MMVVGVIIFTDLTFRILGVYQGIIMVKATRDPIS